MDEKFLSTVLQQNKKGLTERNQIFLKNSYQPFYCLYPLGRKWMFRALIVWYGVGSSVTTLFLWNYMDRQLPKICLKSQQYTKNRWEEH